MEDLGFNIMTEENTQNTQNSGPVTSTQYHVLTDVCDNASEIAEAINNITSIQVVWLCRSPH